MPTCAANNTGRHLHSNVMCNTMNTIIKTILLIIIFPLWTYSQPEYESEIFRSILNFETEKGATRLYIQCNKAKTFFTIKDFKDRSGLQVPDSILTELENSSSNSINAFWDSDLSEAINLGLEITHHLDKCLTKDEVIELFDSTQTRQTVIGISQPIFDSKHENCVVSINYWNFIGSAWGHSYFLRKVYGKWVVIETFGFWMT